MIDTIINDTTIFETGLSQKEIMIDYYRLLYWGLQTYKVVEDKHILIQIECILHRMKKYIQRDLCIKNEILSYIKLYLKNLKTFDKEIIIEEGNLLLEVL
jgi:hypothetical protein